MIRKLQIKLILACMLSLLLVLVTILGLMGILNYRSLVKDADSILELLEHNGGAFPAGKPGGTRPTGRDKLMSPELPYESRYFTVTLDSQGEAISVDTGKIAAVDSAAALDYAKAAYAGGNSKGFMDSYRYKVTRLELSTRVIFLDRGRELGAFRGFLLTGTGVALAGLAAVLLLLIFLSGRIIKPIAQSYEKQRQFITDAGHELKTPLTIIDADAQVLELDLGANEWLEDIQAQTKRLAQLTNSLIVLARMEEQPQAELIAFPLSDLVEETAEAFRAPALTQGKSLSCKIQPMLSMTGDQRAIRQLVGILLDNAVKYSDPGGRIELSLEKQRDQLRLTVFNTAGEIDRDSLPHLFDRFYRADPSRSSQTGGYGLGLAIAWAVVNAHKGKIWASTQDGKSLTVIATFPV